MNRTVTINLDDAGDVERLWNEYSRVRQHREADPELLANLERLLPKMPPELAAEIKEALTTTTPTVVLAEYSDAFFAAKFGTPNPPALGAFERLRDVLVPVDHYAEMVARIKAEPSELGAHVREMLLHTSDLALVIKAALKAAADAGIDQDAAEKITYEAIRKARRVDH